jgi:hypothetical protein
VEPWVNGDKLWLHKKRSGEHRPGKSERGRANQRASRVADGKAELTAAMDGARARRRSQNGRRSSVSGDGATWSRAQSERGGERVRLRAQLSGGKWASGVRLLKRHGLENVAGERAVVGASTARDVGGKLGTD